MAGVGEPSPMLEAGLPPRNRRPFRASRRFWCYRRKCSHSRALERLPCCNRDTQELLAIGRPVALRQLTVFIEETARLQQLPREFGGVVFALVSFEYLFQQLVLGVVHEGSPAGSGEAMALSSLSLRRLWARTIYHGMTPILRRAASSK